MRYARIWFEASAMARGLPMLLPQLQRAQGAGSLFAHRLFSTLMAMRYLASGLIAWLLFTAAIPAATAPSSYPPLQPAATDNLSYNWAGYVAGGGGFSGVSGSWVVPAVVSGTPGADATWVGVGGTNSD